MELQEFEIGQYFYCGGSKWLCTDKGIRVVVAIKVSGTLEVTNLSSATGEKTQHEELVNDWLSGPPFAVAEFVFDK